MPTNRLQKGGFVLVSVLWITAMLTVITLGFGRRAALDRRAARYALDQSEAMMMARGAVDRGIVELHNRSCMEMLLPLPPQKCGTNLGQHWAKTINLFEEDYFEQPEMFENDEVIYVITDEERYININTTEEKVLENIEAMSRSLVRKIKARRTTEVHDREGVAPFQTIEELRYFRGVDDDDWFGEKEAPGLRDLLTVWGGGRINVNTASPEVLNCIPDTRSSDIDAIVAYRAGPDGELYTGDDFGFCSIEELAVEVDVTPTTREALEQYCICTSVFFRITGVATRRQGRVRAVCSAMVSLEDGASAILDWQEKTLGS